MKKIIEKKVDDPVAILADNNENKNRENNNEQNYEQDRNDDTYEADQDFQEKMQISPKHREDNKNKYYNGEYSSRGENGHYNNDYTYEKNYNKGYNKGFVNPKRNGSYNTGAYYKEKDFWSIVNDDKDNNNKNNDNKEKDNYPEVDHANYRSHENYYSNKKKSSQNDVQPKQNDTVLRKKTSEKIEKPKEGSDKKLIIITKHTDVNFYFNLFLGEKIEGLFELKLINFLDK